MNKLLNKLNFFIEKIENYPTNFYFWIISFLSIVFIRITFENWISGFSNKSVNYFFYHLADIGFFFLISFIIFLFLLKFFLKSDFKKLFNVVLWGYLITIFPPIIDHIILKDGFYLSFYGFYGLQEMIRAFFTFFGDSPNFGVTYGVRIEIALTVIFLFIYGLAKTRKLLRSFLLALSSYVILFFFATLPSWITILIEGPSKGFLNVKNIDIARMFVTPTRIFSRDVGDLTNALSVKMSLFFFLFLIILIFLGLFFNYRKKLLIFLKNSRPVQSLYHIGLFVIGAGLGIKFTVITWNVDIFNMASFLNVVAAIFFAWLASVVFNDISDKEIDLISNKNRPLILKEFSKKNYLTIGIILLFSSILYSSIVNLKITMLLVAYQALAWIYSTYPLRLKRIPLVATLTSAVASLLILFSGFILVAPNKDITEIPVQIIWLLAISLTLSLPIKDLKDIEGDRSDGVYTIPVIFGEYWGKIIIGSGIFISYILSILLLHEFDLLFWAIVLGGISFWIVTLSGENKKITHRNVIWWVMGIVFIYLIMLIQYI